MDLASVSQWCREHLGPLALHRPAPSLLTGLAGVGGALVAIAVIIVAGDHWAGEGSSGIAVVLTAAGLGGGVAALTRPLDAHLHAAAAATAGLLAPAFAFFLAAGDGFPSMRLVAVLAGALLAGLYLAGPWSGHTFHLALLVAAVWVFAVSLPDFNFLGAGGFRTLSDSLAAAGAVSCLVGGAYLAAGWWLDGEGLDGMATPFLGVAAVALGFGSFALGTDTHDVVGGLISAAAGAALCVVGARTRRRGTLWLGLVLVAGGVSGVIDGLVDDPAVLAGLLLAAAGAGLALGAPELAARVGEEPPVAPPAEPGGGWPPPAGPPPAGPPPAGPPPASPQAPPPPPPRPPFRI